MYYKRLKKFDKKFNLNVFFNLSYYLIILIYIFYIKEIFSLFFKKKMLNQFSKVLITSKLKL
jgi:hypothetical protein